VFSRAKTVSLDVGFDGNDPPWGDRSLINIAQPNGYPLPRAGLPETRAANMTCADLLAAKKMGHTCDVTIDKSAGERKLLSTHRGYDEACKVMRSAIEIWFSYRGFAQARH
jgi:hypothetical protein